MNRKKLSTSSSVLGFTEEEEEIAELLLSSYPSPPPPASDVFELTSSSSFSSLRPKAVRAAAAVSLDTSAEEGLPPPPGAPPRLLSLPMSAQNSINSTPPSNSGGGGGGPGISGQRGRPSWGSIAKRLSNNIRSIPYIQPNSPVQIFLTVLVNKNLPSYAGTSLPSEMAVLHNLDGVRIMHTWTSSLAGEESIITQATHRLTFTHTESRFDSMGISGGFNDKFLNLQLGPIFLLPIPPPLNANGSPADVPHNFYVYRRGAGVPESAGGSSSSGGRGGLLAGVAEADVRLTPSNFYPEFIKMFCEIVVGAIRQSLERRKIDNLPDDLDETDMVFIEQYLPFRVSLLLTRDIYHSWRKANSQQQQQQPATTPSLLHHYSSSPSFSAHPPAAASSSSNAAAAAAAPAFIQPFPWHKATLTIENKVCVAIGQDLLVEKRNDGSVVKKYPDFFCMQVTVTCSRNGPNEGEDDDDVDNSVSVPISEYTSNPHAHHKYVIKKMTATTPTPTVSAAAAASVLDPRKHKKKNNITDNSGSVARTPEAHPPPTPALSRRLPKSPTTTTATTTATSSRKRKDHHHHYNLSLQQQQHHQSISNLLPPLPPTKKQKTAATDSADAPNGATSSSTSSSFADMLAAPLSPLFPTSSFLDLRASEKDHSDKYQDAQASTLQQQHFLSLQGGGVGAIVTPATTSSVAAAATAKLSDMDMSFSGVTTTTSATTTTGGVPSVVNGNGGAHIFLHMDEEDHPFNSFIDMDDICWEENGWPNGDTTTTTAAAGTNAVSFATDIDHTSNVGNSGNSSSSNSSSSCFFESDFVFPHDDTDAATTTVYGKGAMVSDKEFAVEWIESMQRNGGGGESVVVETDGELSDMMMMEMGGRSSSSSNTAAANTTSRTPAAAAAAMISPPQLPNASSSSSFFNKSILSNMMKSRLWMANKEIGKLRHTIFMMQITAQFALGARSGEALAAAKEAYRRGSMASNEMEQFLRAQYKELRMVFQSLLSSSSSLLLSSLTTPVSGGGGGTPMPPGGMLVGTVGNSSTNNAAAATAGVDGNISSTSSFVAAVEKLGLILQESERVFSILDSLPDDPEWETQDISNQIGDSVRGFYDRGGGERGGGGREGEGGFFLGRAEERSHRIADRTNALLSQNINDPSIGNKQLTFMRSSSHPPLASSSPIITTPGGSRLTPFILSAGPHTTATPIVTNTGCSNATATAAAAGNIINSSAGTTSNIILPGILLHSGGRRGEKESEGGGSSVSSAAATAYYNQQRRGVGGNEQQQHHQHQRQHQQHHSQEQRGGERDIEDYFVG